jgi:phage terminase large subunit-like protein
LTGESPLSWISSLPVRKRTKLVAKAFFNLEAKREFFHRWRGLRARDEQLPPADKDWLVWLLLAGRGFGKTRAGAEAVRDAVEHDRASRIALIGPTAADVRDVMIGGESGLLNISPEPPEYQPSRRRLVWPNGAVAMCFSAEEPQRLRGPQHDLAWADELAAWRYPQQAWDMMMLGLRLGDRPRVIVTTTPKPIALIRNLAAQPTTRLTQGSTYANVGNLAPGFYSAIVARYEGTRLGRQEIHAELLEQAEGALWTRAGIEAARLPAEPVPELKRVVVAIDPAVTSSAGSDETGIVVAGIGYDGLVYVLRDGSGRMTPGEWARRAIALYDSHQADRVVGEGNNGGDLIELTLRTVRPNVSCKRVTARQGKRLRAEPVAALYEQARVRHVGAFPELEDQMCNWVAGGLDPSPDRLDALVWAVAELMLTEQHTGMLDYYRADATRAAS